jgi:hypothetical protein
LTLRADRPVEQITGDVLAVFDRRLIELAGAPSVIDRTPARGQSRCVNGPA